MITAPVMKGPSQKGGGPAILGVLCIVLGLAVLVYGIRGEDGPALSLVIMCAFGFAFIGLQLQTPKQ